MTRSSLIAKRYLVASDFDKAERSPLFRRLGPGAIDDNAGEVDARIALDELSDAF
jgi:hypothetical protein